MDRMSYYTDKLEQVLSDPWQKTAYGTEDSTVVIAGPGSGKTTILTLKIMKLLNGHIKEPHGLACITFSKEAAREFEDRLNLLGYKKRRNVFLGTVHSFCISEILEKFADLYDCGLPSPIKIVPDKLSTKILNDIKKEMGIPTKKYKIEAINKERSLNINGISTIESKSDPTTKKIADEYEKRVIAAGYIDFAGVILYSTKLIQEQEYVRRCLSAKFPWIVIDEYQDLGRPLHEMILSLFTQTDIKIFAVGDPDQSIYGFAGAVPDYLMELYNREDTIPVELKNNYRKMTISHYENDLSDIKGSVIVELAGLLETTTGYLLNGEVVIVGMYEQMKEIREAFMRLGNDKIRQIALEQMKVLATLYNIE